MTSEYSTHPAANLFPMITGQAFDDLVADIKTNGLIHPIVLLGNQILDGRNRMAACDAAGVTPHYREVVTRDPISWIISTNLARRHLNTRQRAAIAADLANMKLGDNQHKKEGVQNCTPSMTTQQAANAMGVSKRSVDSAKKVKRDNPAEHAAVKRGEKLAPKPSQKQPVADAVVRSAPQVVKEWSDKKKEEARRDRMTCEQWDALNEVEELFSDMSGIIGYQVSNLYSDISDRQDEVEAILRDEILAEIDALNEGMNKIFNRPSEK